MIYKFNEWINNGFTWNTIKKNAYVRVDALNILLSDQKFTYKYIDMVYNDLYKNIKPDISTLIPNSYDSELVLLNIKTPEKGQDKQIYIYNNIHSKPTYLTDNITMTKNDAIQYCKEFVKFIKSARKSLPPHEAILLQMEYKLEYNCQNTEHSQGLYVKYKRCRGLCTCGSCTPLYI